MMRCCEGGVLLARTLQVRSSCALSHALFFCSFCGCLAPARPCVCMCVVCVDVRVCALSLYVYMFTAATVLSWVCEEGGSQSKRKPALERWGRGVPRYGVSRETQGTGTGTHGSHVHGAQGRAGRL